ncbi:extracellular solute-binding protein [Microlunatus soli]|uniref:Putative aldouronate transport system substrate-binding protein n=1 Tax=Microlunatus soli TaxID=630515 RepID=A0A1H1YPP0_9ACTN|nr:extracellular solute-binding protein [Microlunatus soli]SDT23076.1 putative aldouronate transport system substrate-binding protein [Microlunatus soli]
MINHPVSRRQLMTIGTAGAVGLGLAGCSTGAPTSSTGSRAETVLPSYKPQQPATGAGAVSSEVDDLPQIYTRNPTRYWSSVEAPPGDGGQVTTFQMLWFAPPAAVGKNPYWQQLNKNLNVDYRPTLASSDTYNDKLATVLAGGNVPDLAFIQDQVAVGAQAIQQGAFADLTDVLAGDKILKYPNLANLPTYGWQNSAKNGRIFGIPHVNPAVSSSATIRTDLMRAAGYREQPTSADEMLALFTDLSKIKKFGGKQVWPIGGLGTYQIQRFVSWMQGVGPSWREDGGKLINQLETDEFASTIDYLIKLWKAGCFHPDALALGSDSQRSKEKQMWTEGRFAFELDSPPWLAQQGMQQVEDGTQGAIVDFLQPAPADGVEVVVERDAGYWGIVGISAKAAEDDRKLDRLLGICNYFAAPYGTTESLFLGSGIEGYNFRFGADKKIIDLDNSQAETNLQGLHWLGASSPSTITLDGVNARRKDNLLADLEMLTKASKTDPTVGLYSDAQTRSSAKLDQLNEDWRNKIVTGRAPMTAIAQWRQEWRRAGGDQVRQEFQDAMQKGH